MKNQKINSKLKAVKLADAINSIKGVPISKNAKLLSEKWINGEISGKEMKEQLIRAHRVPDKITSNKPTDLTLEVDIDNEIELSETEYNKTHKSFDAKESLEILRNKHFEK